MPRTLTPQRARSLAYEWHGGQWSPLYAFASSGLVQDQSKLLAEIKSCMPSTAEDQRDLVRLYNYVLTQLEHRPADAYPWRAPWAKDEIR